MITLAEMRLAAKQRADMVNSKFVSDSEWNYYINAELAAFYDLMCEAYGQDYFVEEYEFTTTDAGAYALPDDFYELSRLDIKLDSQDWITIPRFNLNQETTLRSASYVAFGGYLNTRYRLVGNTLKLAPIPAPGSIVRALYVPLPAKLVNDSDELQDFNAYSDYIITGAAIRALNKEESDVSVLMAQQQEQKARIVGKAANRDVANPEQITDIYATQYYPWRGVK